MAHCPRCLVERLRKPESEHTGHPCRGCRGAWLPAEAAARLIADPFGPLDGLPRVTTGSNALRCPDCEAELQRRRVAGVEIDVCPAHGVWFDHREIDRVRTAADHHRRRGPLPAPPASSDLAATAITAAAIAVTPVHGRASQSDGVTLELAADAADLAVSTAEATVESGDVAVAVLEVVDVGEVTGGALEILSTALEALFSGL